MVQSIDDSSLYNISNQINWRKSQMSILYIKLPVFFFFTEKQYMKTPTKVSIKVQNSGTLSRMSIYNVNHLQVYFLGRRSSLIFLAEE